MIVSDTIRWHIRQAEATDADALALIGSATFLETFSGVLAGQDIISHCVRVHNATAYRSMFSGGGQMWLAELEPGNAPVGFALVGQPDLPTSKVGDIELKRIYCLSRFHGCGLGGGLMDAVINATSGYRRLLLGVYAGNTRAQAFYHKHGFAKVADRKFDVGGTLYDDVVMAKPLIL